MGNIKSNTVVVHGGYDTEATTRAVAVPIYQTVAYEFEERRSWRRIVQS